jgi:hypothetical protein
MYVHEYQQNAVICKAVSYTDNTANTDPTDKRYIHNGIAVSTGDIHSISASQTQVTKIRATIKTAINTNELHAKVSGSQTGLGISCTKV